MSEIIYKIDVPNEFSAEEKEEIKRLLILQGKIQKVTIEKINRCKFICICQVDKNIIAIGAIKPKTNSDFNSDKADLDKMRNEFQDELGYCFTLKEHSGKGHSSKIVNLLLDKNGIDKNIMASTELRVDNPMVGILEKNDFRQYGNSWKSIIHNGTLGLFLKFGKQKRTNIHVCPFHFKTKIKKLFLHIKSVKVHYFSPSRYKIFYKFFFCICACVNFG